MGLENVGGTFALIDSYGIFMAMIATRLRWNTIARLAGEYAKTTGGLIIRLLPQHGCQCIGAKKGHRANPEAAAEAAR